MEAYKQTTRVVSIVLLLRRDPVPEWPVSHCPEPFNRFRERSILSLFKSGHVWASLKDGRKKAVNRKEPYAVSTLFYNNSYAIEPGM